MPSYPPAGQSARAAAWPRTRISDAWIVARKAAKAAGAGMADRGDRAWRMDISQCEVGAREPATTPSGIGSIEPPERFTRRHREKTNWNLAAKRGAGTARRWPSRGFLPAAMGRRAWRLQGREFGEKHFAGPHDRIGSFLPSPCGLAEKTKLGQPTGPAGNRRLYSGQDVRVPIVRSSPPGDENETQSDPRILREVRT